MDLQTAMAVVLQYDVMPVALRSANQKAALEAAKRVVQQAAYRAVSDYTQKYEFGVGVG
jgi:hypothetical protein